MLLYVAFISKFNSNQRVCSRIFSKLSKYSPKCQCFPQSFSSVKRQPLLVLRKLCSFLLLVISPPFFSGQPATLCSHFPLVLLLEQITRDSQLLGIKGLFPLVVFRVHGYPALVSWVCGGAGLSVLTPPKRSYLLKGPLPHQAPQAGRSQHSDHYHHNLDEVINNGHGNWFFKKLPKGI